MKEYNKQSKLNKERVNRYVNKFISRSRIQPETEHIPKYNDTQSQSQSEVEYIAEAVYNTAKRNNNMHQQQLQLDSRQKINEH
jgi:hypothetical protein